MTDNTNNNDTNTWVKPGGGDGVHDKGFDVNKTLQNNKVNEVNNTANKQETIKNDNNIKTRVQDLTTDQKNKLNTLLQRYGYLNNTYQYALDNNYGITYENGVPNFSPIVQSYPSQVLENLINLAQGGRLDPSLENLSIEDGGLGQGVSNKTLTDYVDTDRYNNTKSLQDGATVSELPMTSFTEFADLSILMNDQLATRLDTVKDIVLYNGVNINLDDYTSPLDFEGGSLADVCEELTGSRIVDENTARCISRIANYSDATSAFKKAIISDDPSEKKDMLSNMFSDERISEAFPEFGLELLGMILYMCCKLIVVIMLGKLCEMTTKIFDGKFDMSKIPIVGKGLGCVGCKIADMFKWIFNNTATGVMAIVDGIVGLGLQVFTIMPLTVLKLKVTKSKNDKGKTVYKAEVTGTRYLNVCSNHDINLDHELANIQKNIKIRAKLSGDNWDPVTGLHTPVNKCDPSYVPTYAERASAQHLAEEIMRIETDSYNSKPLPNGGENFQTKPGPYSFTKYSLLDKLHSDSQVYASTSKLMAQQLQPQPGHFVADKADAQILGFFVTMNGWAQKADREVTKFLALQSDFIKPFREYICCSVRFLFLILPRMLTYAAANDKEKVDQMGPLLAKASEYLGREDVQTRMTAKFNELMGEEERNTRMLRDMMKGLGMNETDVDKMGQDKIWEIVIRDELKNSKDEQLMSVYSDYTKMYPYKDVIKMRYYLQYGFASYFNLGKGKRADAEKAADKEKYDRLYEQAEAEAEARMKEWGMV